MIRAAELRTVSIQYNQILTAQKTFRDKYFALPGDMANAVSFWGAADGSTGQTAACQTAASTSTATCNGNADGNIGILSYSIEHFRFWQHLANAGLIEGAYDGVTHGSTNTSVTAENVLKSKLDNGLWHITTWGTNVTGNGSFFDGNYAPYIEFGRAVANADPNGAIMKPEEAWNIDTKIDDTMPATGKMWVRDVSGFSGNNCTTATASSQSNANYNLNRTNNRCVLIFPQPF